MPISATVTAAIISAAATAGSSAIATAVKGISPDAGGMLGAIENQTFAGWTYWTSAIVHGQWEKSFSKDLTALTTAQTYYTAWLQSGDAPSSTNGITDVTKLSESLQVLLAAWIKVQDLASSENITDFGYTNGINAGTNAFFIYHDTDKKHAIACNLRNPVYGPIYVGCINHSFEWMYDIVTKKGWGRVLSDHVDNHHGRSGSHTVISTAGSAVATSGAYSCQFTASKQTTFTIEVTS